jgi:predicted extracellular nuclease
MTEIDLDISGRSELQNNGYDSESAIATLVSSIIAATGNR